MFFNIGGLPFHNSAPKNKEFTTIVRVHRIDILGVAEVNINWNNLPFMHQLQERMMPWWEARRVSWVHNTHDEWKSWHQWGGVAMFSINKMAH